MKVFKTAKFKKVTLYGIELLDLVNGQELFGDWSYVGEIQIYNGRKAKAWDRSGVAKLEEENSYCALNKYGIFKFYGKVYIKEYKYLFEDGKENCFYSCEPIELTSIKR